MDINRELTPKTYKCGRLYEDIQVVSDTENIGFLPPFILENYRKILAETLADYFSKNFKLKKRLKKIKN